MQMFEMLADGLSSFAMKTGVAEIAMKFADGGWKTLVMLLIACVLLYLAIVKKFEPLLLLPIAFGMLLANLPLGGVMHPEYFIDPEYLLEGGKLNFSLILNKGGLLDLLYLGVKLGIYPPLIFLGIGCMTDFGPLISNPKSILLGAAAQLGVFITFFCAVLLGAFGLFGFGADGNVATIFKEAASIGIIGGADGPTAIFVTKTLAPGLLSAIAIAAYSYMALIPLIQPPIMKALTTKKERQIVMEQLRPVTQKEKIIFPIAVSLIVILLVPDSASLVGTLMLGNLIKESGVAERLCKTAQNELMNIITIFLGITVGATATADTFLTPKTVLIICLGLAAFSVSTMGGLLLGKVMCKLSGGKINPLIGSAGVSAVPMAARMSQVVGQEENPSNFLLMHAMGPNVAGVIGSAVAAGVFLANFTGI
ncbi:MAG: sodium ion-translocating decarboxylase subunit beta [Clostridia bacterium]|nr:sodium ion-translocating decarboxylase subunit beta [Clostridia bacterium]